MATTATLESDRFVTADGLQNIILSYLEPLVTFEPNETAYTAIAKLLEPESFEIAKLLRTCKNLDDIYPTLVADCAAECGIRAAFYAMTQPPPQAQASIAEWLLGVKADLRDRIEMNS